MHGGGAEQVGRWHRAEFALGWLKRERLSVHRCDLNPSAFDARGALDALFREAAVRHRAAAENRSTAFSAHITRHIGAVFTRHSATMSSGSDRTQRYRRRKAAGLAVFTIAADPIAIGEWLADCGFVEQWDVEDHDRVQRALQEAIAVWSAI
jgi:hypothetical protein